MFELPDTIGSYVYTPPDAHAEGVRARRAGLSADNPYRLWPCVAAQWADGWALVRLPDAIARDIVSQGK
jgi:hypothetical protein